MDEALGFCGEFVFFYLLVLMAKNTSCNQDFFQVNFLIWPSYIYALATLPAAQETVGVKWKSAFLHFTDEDGNLVPKSIKARRLRRLLVYPGIFRTSISCSFNLSRGALHSAYDAKIQ